MLYITLKETEWSFG